MAKLIAHDCQAISRRGVRCQAYSLPGEQWCFTHHPDRQDAVAEARSKGGRIKALQGRRLKLETSRSLARFTATVLQDARDGLIDPDTARAVLYGISIQAQAIQAAEQREMQQLSAEVRSLVEEARRRGLQESSSR
jgi:hypothetical protein